VNELKLGANRFDYSNSPLISTPEFRLPTITIGSPYNYPQHIGQNAEQYRDDLFWLKGSHSFKVGFDYLHNDFHGNFGQNPRGTVLGFLIGSQHIESCADFPGMERPQHLERRGSEPLCDQLYAGIRQLRFQHPDQCNWLLVSGRLESVTEADVEPWPSL
jgi:hypothetical protein